MSSEHPEPSTPLAESTPDDPFGTPTGEADLDAAALDDVDDVDEEPIAGPTGKRTVLALLVGLLLAILGAAIWTALVYQTGRRFAVAAVVVGLLIGFVVRKVARRTSVVLALVAALLALTSAFAGSWFEVYASVARQKHPVTQKKVGWSEAFELKTDDVWTSLKDGIEWTSYLTWVLAASAAFVYALDSGKKKVAPGAPVVGEVGDLEGGDGDGDGGGLGEPGEFGDAAGPADTGDDPVDSGDD